ncbi:MAG: single-stranded DNA-binding protein [Verrucomicrobiales bacterium]|nr:single-stranded DNA-binding protein [Verrucomicrobiales bacterium]|tara:strand:- start:26671 stop:27180 length:510 start_codon:yes stop_codon:yes gene_type:complete
MASFNKVILMGNLTRDPELRYTPNGTAVAQIGIAVNRVWRNQEGQQQEEVTFIDVDVFGRTAENVGQYMRKGRPILIEGRLKLDQWDDRNTGQKRSKLKVVADTVQFLGGRDGGQGGGGGGGNFQQGNQGGGYNQGGYSDAPPQRPDSPRPQAPPADDMPPPEDDDVPF